MAHDFQTNPELRNNQLQELQFQSPHKQITEDFEATVVKVHDGDTVTLEVDFRDFQFPLRLFGINSPEMNEGGEVARDWLRARILGEKVEIILSSERVEKWGRLLGEIFHGGQDVGEEEVMLGLATTWEGRKEGKIINPIKEIKWL